MRPETLSLEAEAAFGTPPAETAFLADDDGLERVEPHGGGSRVTWESLRQVTLRARDVPGLEGRAVHRRGR